MYIQPRRLVVGVCSAKPSMSERRPKLTADVYQLAKRTESAMRRTATNVRNRSIRPRVERALHLLILLEPLGLHLLFRCHASHPGKFFAADRLPRRWLALCKGGHSRAGASGLHSFINNRAAQFKPGGVGARDRDRIERISRDPFESLGGSSRPERVLDGELSVWISFVTFVKSFVSSVVKKAFFNRKGRKGIRKGRKEKKQRRR